MPCHACASLICCWRVDAWTGFSECFTHQRSGKPADDHAALLATAVLADGINLGLTPDGRDQPRYDRAPARLDS